MVNCENCNEIIAINYASGRFCSKRCTKSFSTKSGRQSINTKISESIKSKLMDGDQIGFWKGGFEL